ncbi:MAG: hypothetical protein DSZ31_03840 [Gammaproteobacteria bacterium]|nr:MAG: hypothetical protein DSZ31_03840 [Gammaproteobacteria bacterium]
MGLYAPAIAMGSLICSVHPEYQDKNEYCDLSIQVLDRYANILKKMDNVEVWGSRDGVDKDSFPPKRVYYGSFVYDGKKYYLILEMNAEKEKYLYAEKFKEIKFNDLSIQVLDSYANLLKKMDNVRVWGAKDAIDKNIFPPKRVYFGSFVYKGTKYYVTLKIGKPLHLCDKDGWWIRQTGAIGYEAVLCKNGKVKRDYQTIFKGLEMSPTSAYSTYLLKFGNPSGSDSPMAPQFLYNVAGFDQECNGKIIGRKFEPLDEVSKRIEEKCKGKDIYFYICVKRGIDVLCYPRTDPTAAP